MSRTRGKEGALCLPNPLWGMLNACYLNAALQIVTSMEKLTTGVKEADGGTLNELARIAIIKRSPSHTAVEDKKALLQWFCAVLPDHLRPRGKQGDAHEALIVSLLLEIGQP